MKSVDEMAPTLRVHELKTAGDVWDLIDEGCKKAEVRLNDRDYRAQDILVLRRLDADGNVMPNLGIVRRVHHVFEGGRYGIEPGYVLLSLNPVDLNTTQAAFLVLRQREEVL